MRAITWAFLGAVMALVPPVVAADRGRADTGVIRGDYVEARTADVFTGPCFSNAEMLITGDRAVMAWKVTDGSWKGVELKGLCVAAALQGDSTFSADDPTRAKAVVIVDSRADSRQRAALIDLAKNLGGARLSHVEAITAARMSLKLEEHAEPAAHQTHGMPYAARASFWAAGLAQVVTRPLDERDHACGNEVIAYPPLSRGVTAQPAFTLGHEFKGDGLQTRWSDPRCRSSFVGHFSI
jgi:hypothetical protein